MYYNEKYFIAGLPWICAVRATVVSYSSKGEISTLFLNHAMVSAFLMACGILFQALGAVYKKLFFVCSRFRSNAALYQ